MGLLRRKKRDIRVPTGRDAVNFRKLLFLQVRETQDLLTNDAWDRVGGCLLTYWSQQRREQRLTMGVEAAGSEVPDAHEDQDAAGIVHRERASAQRRQADPGALLCQLVDGIPPRSYNALAEQVQRLTASLSEQKSAGEMGSEAK